MAEPNLKRTAPPATDAFGKLALALYVVVGGVLVAGFAGSLHPAVSVQGASVCAALSPEPRHEPAPDFTVQDLQGRPVSLADFRGKFVILNFWATWCEPCVTEWPQMYRLAERFADREDIVVLAVSIDDTREGIAPFLERMSLAETSVRVLWDPEQTLNKTYGTEKIPDTYFIDEQGQIQAVFINVRRWGGPAAYACVDGSAGRAT